MGTGQSVFIGTDCGATTSKIGGVWADGTPISTELLQRPTNAQLGPEAVVRGWVESIGIYLERSGLEWAGVQGVAVAIPGPRRSYGVLERGPNLPESFVGFDVYTAYSQALAERAGRPIPLAVGNDGNMGGVAEAQRVRGAGRGSVLMLAPGSGLGCAYIDGDGLPLDGDTLAGMEASHMPAPLHLLAARRYPCGCGRDWGCVEVYTSLAGLPYLLEERLGQRPDHPLASSPLGPKERAFALHVATLAMALDPQFVVIGGGLMDEGATTPEFRERYLRTIWEAAEPHLWPTQRSNMQIVRATLGDLSQAIGAALVALYQSK
jgi:glucokinase